MPSHRTPLFSAPDAGELLRRPLHRLANRATQTFTILMDNDGSCLLARSSRCSRAQLHGAARTPFSLPKASASPSASSAWALVGRSQALWRRAGKPAFVFN